MGARTREKGKDKRKDKQRKGGKSKGRRKLAETADRHALYEASVQDVETEVELLTEMFEGVRGRRPVTLREDFAGTAAAACQWVRAGDDHRAWAVDIDPEVLDWGRRHHVKALTPEQRERLNIIEGDVRATPTPPVDLLIAFNFSYWFFQTREELRRYFEVARRGLAPDGILLLDAFGGSESFEEGEEETDMDDFVYIWDQHRYDPISGRFICHIHFRFPDKSEMREAFSYEWRLWTLPEIRELLAEAGFSRSTVYWEGTDEDGEGNGEYAPAEHGEADPAWIVYILAEK